ncbi:MAG: acyltransferase family protein [Hyphomonas sp.]
MGQPASNDRPAGIAGAPGGPPRLDALDGLRGLAALAVVFFHFTARWTVPNNGESLYPYGDMFPPEAQPWFNMMIIGVNLFFLISGFVMVIMLRHSTGLADFALRRLSRIWPVLILAATLTTLIIHASGIHERFDSISDWSVSKFEFVSSILMIDPAFLGGVVGKPGNTWVDGVYWTLWVDIRFYVLVALTYWLFSGRTGFAAAWIAVQLASIALLAVTAFTPANPHWSLHVVLQPHYLPWFTLGIAACYLRQDRNYRAGFALALTGLAALVLDAVVMSELLFHGSVWVQLGIYSVFIGLFALAIVRSPVLKVFTQPWVLTLGLASFPLYIFHERVGIIAMNLMADLGVPALLTLPLVIAGAVAIALVIHRFVEMPVRRRLLTTFQPATRRLEKAMPFLKFRRQPAVSPPASATPAVEAGRIRPAPEAAGQYR